MNILSDTKIQFLTISKTHCKYTDTVDFSNKPRPFFSIGLIISGKGKFCTENAETVHVEPGDIIVVPTSARYISHWSGTPDILYISFHFIFEKRFDNVVKIQKLAGFKPLKSDFEFAYDNFSFSAQSFKMLSIFYNILNEVFPKIEMKSKKPMSTSVKNAIDYIIFRYTRKIKISELSKAVNLSPSRLFTVFKKETGLTPIEYKNRICIKNAEKMLLTTDLSIEEISEKLGFNSSSYFRRTFKNFTGKSPKDYKNSIKTDLKL